MSDANKALAEVRGWLCDNLSSGDAGKVCGMLSVVSRRINEIEDENGKLRDAMYADAKRHGLQHMDADELRIWATQQADYIERLRCFLHDVWPFVEAGRDDTCVMARCFMFDECCLDESDGYECPAMRRMDEVMNELGVLDE